MAEYNCTLCGRRFGSRGEAYSHVCSMHERDAREINPSLFIKEATESDRTVSYYDPRNKRKRKRRDYSAYKHSETILSSIPNEETEEVKPDLKRGLWFLLLFILIICIFVLPLVLMKILVWDR